MRVILMCIVCCCAAFCCADGLPISNGKIETDHTVLNLTDSQAEEVEILGTLTLSDVQWRQLRKVGPACPKRFTQVVPITYEGCGCGLSDFVVMLSKKKAGVLHSKISADEMNGVVARFGFEKEKKYKVDGRGEFFLDGKPVLFSALKKSMSQGPVEVSDENMSVPPPTVRYINGQRMLVKRQKNSFDIRPLLMLGGLPLSSVVEKRIEELRKAAEDAGWVSEDNLLSTAPESMITTAPGTDLAAPPPIIIH